MTRTRLSKLLSKLVRTGAVILTTITIVAAVDFAAPSKTELWITGPINEQSITLKMTLRELTRNKTLPTIIYVNSPGGYVYLEERAIKLMKERKSKVVVVITGMAASAAAVISVNADKLVMSDKALIMFHTMSYIDAAGRQVKLIEETAKICLITYCKYLTKAQVDAHNRGEDVWISGKTFAQQLADKGYLVEKTTTMVPTADPLVKRPVVTYTITLTARGA